MKKILILITIILLANGVAAAVTIDNDGVGHTTNQSGVGQDTNQSGVGNSQNQSGVGQNTNIMFGTGGDTAVNNAALGNQNAQSELYRTTSYNPNSSAISMPELSLGGIVTWIAKILNQLIYVIIAATLVMFLYGVFKLSFVDGQKPESREQSRKFMFWGIVSLFVMVSVWGLVNILQSTFFSGGLVVPQFK